MLGRKAFQFSKRTLSSRQIFTENNDNLVTVEYDKDASGQSTGVVIVKLNSPEKLNPLTIATGKIFKNKIKELSEDKNIAALILTGSGKAFSAGGDLKFLEDRTNDSPLNNITIMRQFYDRFLCIRDVPFPTIAALNGSAVGAGCCVSLACDIRLAADSAKLGLNFVRLGLSPGMGGTHFLPLVTNMQVAKRLIFTGDLISGTEAKEMGLVLDIYPKDQVLQKAIELGRRIAEASPSTVRMVVKTLRKQDDNFNGGLLPKLEAEALAQAQCYAMEDMKEGISAVKEKRSPKFKKI